MPPNEFSDLWHEFEVKRNAISKEMGRVPAEHFHEEYWPGLEDNKARFWHGWKWWLALSQMDPDLRDSFFSDHVDGFDRVGLAIFKPETPKEAFGRDLPDSDEPHIQRQWQAFQHQQQQWKDAARKALLDELEMMEGFKQLDLSVAGAMDKWSSS